MTALPQFVTRCLVGCIRGYQGLRAGRVSPCRFYPSCSAYGIEALQVHGVVGGLRLTLRRILHCRPGGPTGIDLVPGPTGTSSPLSSAPSSKV